MSNKYLPGAFIVIDGQMDTITSYRLCSYGNGIEIYCSKTDCSTCEIYKRWDKEEEDEEQH